MNTVEGCGREIVVGRNEVYWGNIWGDMASSWAAGGNETTPAADFH